MTQEETIGRAEYQADMQRLEQEIKDLRADLSTSVKELSSGVSQLALALQRGRVSVWQFIAVSSLNFILSGAFLSVILFASGHIH